MTLAVPEVLFMFCSVSSRAGEIKKKYTARLWRLAAIGSTDGFRGRGEATGVGFVARRAAQDAAPPKPRSRPFRRATNLSDLTCLGDRFVSAEITGTDEIAERIALRPRRG
jgi:hypothetical protein